jgi:hypothetical protein
MARYTVGFDNRWQETFDDLDEATAWAREVAATGRTVEVIGRRLGLFAYFITGFPESEREKLEARWSRPGLFGTGLFAASDAGGASHHYGHALGGHGGGGHGGGHGGHGGH